MSATRTARTRAITTAASGIVTYRTRRPLTAGRADRFATMLQANPAFLDATVVRARSAGKFHVRFLPAAAARIEVMLDREDGKDRDAAARDGCQFRFVELAADAVRELIGMGRVFLCKGIAGKYETTLGNGGACSCPHFRFRRNSSGGRCKHIIALEAREAAGLLDPCEPAAPPVEVKSIAPGAYGSPEWNARVMADFA